MKKLILILTITFAFSNFTNANNLETNSNLIEVIADNDFDCELLSLMEQGMIKSITVDHESLEECTLTAEVSYNGVAISLSITADTCYEAGQGVAQAVKGFYAEVSE